MTDIANLAFQVNTKSLTSATTSLKNFKKVGEDTERSIMRNTARMKTSFQSVGPSITGAGTAAAKAAPKFQGFGHQARMVSMQLSQVAQQGSVTGNYLQALAIQLPDLMLGFGALGIMVGAVAGSLASYFINSARDSEKASENLLDEINELTDGFKNLTVAQRESIRVELAPKIQEEIEKRDKATKSVQDYAKWIATVTDNLKNLKRLGSIGKWGEVETLEHFTERAKKLRDNIDQMTASMNAQQTAADNAALKIDKYNKTIADPSGGAAEAAEAEADRIFSARSNLLDKLESIEDKYKSPAQRAFDQMAEEKNVLAASYSQNIIDFQAYKEQKDLIDQKYSEDSIARAKKEQEQKNQLLTAGQQQGLGIMAGQLGQMAALAKEGGKKQFENWKALATAQAIISAALAVNNAYAVPIVGPALAVTAGILGAAQVGIIQNTEYQGARAMGGQVESGGKYLVGENGPEVLQLGSQGGSVTPNHALGGGGGNVTTVVNIAAGVTKAELEAFAPTIISSSVNAVKQQIAAGGTMSKAVGRR